MHKKDDLFRSLIELLPEIVFSCTTNGDIIYFNQKWYAYTGNKSGDISQESWIKIVHPDDLLGLIEKRKAAKLSQQSWEHEFRLKRKDGSYRWHLMRSNPNIHTDQELKDWSGAITDIHEQKLAQQTLQMSEATLQLITAKSKENEEQYRQTVNQLQVIFQATGEAIMVQDQNYNIIYANDLAAMLCGFNSVEEFRKADLNDVIQRSILYSETGELFPKEKLTARRVLNGESFAEAVYKVKSTVTNHESWTKSFSRAIRNKENVVQFAVTVFRDITAEVEAEKNSQILTEASTLFASSLDFNETISSLGELMVPMIADWYSIELVNEHGLLETMHTVTADPKKTEIAHQMKRRYPANPNSKQGTYKVLRSGNPEIIRDISLEMLLESGTDDEHREMLRTLNIRSCVIVPLKVRDQSIGVMSLCHADSGRRFRYADLKLITEIAYRAGLAIENARLYGAAQAAKLKSQLSEERLELALEGSKIGLWEWRIQEDQLFYSDRCLEIFRIKRTDFQGSFYNDFIQVIHPSEIERVKKSVQEAVEKNTDYAIEYRIIRFADKTEGWVQAKGKTYYDESGKPVRMVGTITDISVAKHVEERKKRVEQKVAKLQSISALLSKAITPIEIAKIVISEGLKAIDADAGVIFLIDNEAQVLRSVYTLGYADIKKYSYSAELKLDIRTPITDAYTTGQSIVLPTKKDILEKYPDLLNSPESQMRNALVVVPLKVHDTILGSLGLSFNQPQDLNPSLMDYIQTLADHAAQALDRAYVYEQAQEERLRANQANQAKSLFLANMSHEIRTPMNAILGFAKLLNDADLSEDDREDFLRRIDINGDHLLHLIDDILDLSRVEAGQMRVVEQPFSLKELIDDIFKSLEVLVSEKNIQTRLELGKDLPNALVSDPMRLKQVLTNLISNAAKFTDNGHITMRAFVKKEEHKLIFEIEDTGIGIAQEVQGSLFKAFSQGDDSVTRKFGGTGLGLVLSKKICESLHGNLTLIKSDVNQGALFQVTLPLNEYKESAHVERSLKNKNMNLKGSQALKILLAEDSLDNQALIEMYMRNTNMDLETVNNGEEAVQRLKEEPYDVVLMDIQMPHLDGLEATRRARASGFKKPIIALTAHALPEEINRSLAAGCNSHLTKPISRADLINEINRLSGRSLI